MVAADPPAEPSTEEATDALVDGDVALVRGTARAALAHRDFRLVWGGTLASNVGTWMQNVLLGAFAYDLTGSATFVGVVFFAQLGPLLLFSTVGGLLADALDRRRLLVGLQLVQLVLSLGLAALVATDAPSRAALVGIVFAIGVANSLAAPGLSAILPTLVPREDLPGAVALQSVQMNLSRVVGPAIGAVVYDRVGAAPVFTLNALTYLFAVIGLTLASYSARSGTTMVERGFARLASGFRVAAADVLVRRVLLTLASFSFVSLMFVGLMPVIAEESLGIPARSTGYGLLYAAFGLGAALGAVSVGTVFASRSKAGLLRPWLVVFALLLATFALLRQPAPAYPTVFALGYAYFVVLTSLSTVLQAHLDDAVRGRVMALWIMGFGGTVPLGVLLGGALVGPVSLTAVICSGALWALALAMLAPRRAFEPAAVAPGALSGPPPRRGR